MKKYRQAVFIVVYSNTENGLEYLVLKRRKHWAGWEFPKGGVEDSETLEKTVRREVAEEVGLEILEIKKYNFSGKYNYRKSLSDRSKFVGQSFQLYSAEVKFGKVKIDSHEHSIYRWLPFKDAYKKLTWKDQKESLKIVDESLKIKNF